MPMVHHRISDLNQQSVKDNRTDGFRFPVSGFRGSEKQYSTASRQSRKYLPLSRSRRPTFAFDFPKTGNRKAETVPFGFRLPISRFAHHNHDAGSLNLRPDTTGINHGRLSWVTDFQKYIPVPATTAPPVWATVLAPRRTACGSKPMERSMNSTALWAC